MPVLRNRRKAWALLLAVGACAAAAEPVRTILLVRHAERAGGMTGDSVPISPLGQCRAKALAGIVAGAGIARIYTSEALRTQQTAEPSAKKLNIQPETVPAKDVDALVAKLRSSWNGNALVVGHSNTLPDIIRKLGAGDIPPIADTEYDRLFVVTLIGSIQASVVTLRFAGCAP
jgi:broad specificity phosphatase PhoE